MSGKKRGPKPRYEEEDVLEAMAVYFYEHVVVRKEDLSVFTMDAIYDDIQHDALPHCPDSKFHFPSTAGCGKC